MSHDDGLFELPADARRDPAEHLRAPDLSAGRRLTLRQTATLAAGWHPLGPRLHAEAAPHNDRDAPGRRCGNCQHRELFSHHSRTYPKCWYGWDGKHVTARLSHGAASDCRAWWPGCVDHLYAEHPTDDDEEEHR